MISFVQMCQDLPYVEFRSYYEKALKANQKNIEAIAISSFSKDNNFVDSRFVNLKFINEKEFIFFPIIIRQSQNNLKLIHKFLPYFFGGNQYSN